MQNLAYKYVYTTGSVLESCWREISKSVQQIFANDLQGRLLHEAGDFFITSSDEEREIHVVVATNVEKYEYTERDLLGGFNDKPRVATAVKLTPQSEEIYIGRAVIHKRDGDGKRSHDIFRAEVPPFLFKTTETLPAFPK